MPNVPERELAHLRALAACGRALLAGDDEESLREALEAVLHASGASSVFVERNVDEREVGFASRMLMEVGVPGIDLETERWQLVAWERMPETRAALERGDPFVVVPEELGPVEGATYHGAGIFSELDYPVFSGGRWLGVVGFSEERWPREWDDDDVRLLAAVAELFARRWDLGDRERALEAAVAKAQRRVDYERALAECSQALLGGHARALQLALDTLVLATGAQFGTIERNVDHPQVGPCSQVVCRTAVDPATGELEHDFDAYWFLVPWSRMPDSYERLSKGVPFAFSMDELGPWERELYDASPVPTAAEIDIPIIVKGQWRGLLAFGFSAAGHLWEPEDAALLQTAADIVGAYWLRQEAQERLEQLIRSKDEFLAAVSHELRTPLTTVVGLAEELRDRADDFSRHERDEFTALIAQQGMEMAQLVEDLLVAARAEIGAIEVSPAPVDVGKEVAVVVSGARATKAVAIRGEADVVAWADAMRTHQIIRNLVTNAVRYGGPAVTVRYIARGEVVTVSVSDDGPEIPADDRERIFEAYQRAHHRPTQPASVGLGLTVSRSLAQLMGGDLRYRREDGCNVFELTLPRNRPD